MYSVHKPAAAIYECFLFSVISSWEHMQVCTQPTEPARRPLHVDITQCSCCDRGRHSHSTSLMSPSVPTAQFSQTAVPLKKSGHGWFMGAHNVLLFCTTRFVIQSWSVVVVPLN
jgi:hypothetical protein